MQTASLLTLSLLFLSPLAVCATPPAPVPVQTKAGMEGSLPATPDASRPVKILRSTTGQPLNMGSLEVIQSETVLFEAQVSRARALDELQKSGSEATASLPFNPAPPADGNPQAIKGTTDNTPPEVIEISGQGTSLSALLSLSNGNQVYVRTGGRVPGTDYTVSKITLDEVVLSARDKSLLSLSFSG